jgi:hypothetical protein
MAPERRPIPLRPDPDLLRADTLTSLARAIIARTMACLGHQRGRDEPTILRSRFPDDHSAALMLRAVTSPFNTGAASALLRTVVADIIASIGQIGAGARLLQSCLVLSFDNGIGTVKIPGIAVSANKAAFIAEGAPIPVNDLVAAAATLEPRKLASIFTLTSEMIAGSNAEVVVTDAMLRCVGLALDNVLFDSNAADAVRPAGLRHGIAALPSSPGTGTEAMIADLGAVSGSVARCGGPIALVVAPERAITIALRLPPDPPFAVYGSPGVAADDVIAIAVNGLGAAVDFVPQIEMSRVTTLDMESPAQPIMTGGAVRSLMQTDTAATKVRFGASWALRDPRALAWLSTTRW